MEGNNPRKIRERTKKAWDLILFWRGRKTGFHLDLS
ncbi:hypothetical protein P872_04395 [Rhodonellum psychrophilum GCM71 = DSM 17998]|uniref:Uncharacterized protein n=1 Tax=Rhodonellum psychrophilum GCM71 = DSM 17998 TaxID=1123057 RepID=U5BY31_9BACT|nr:hypothetical protein P872_04395 [Rhodonellum psychrophilum GCM71 = DSM 17998]